MELSKIDSLEKFMLLVEFVSSYGGTEAEMRELGFAMMNLDRADLEKLEENVYYVPGVEGRYYLPKRLLDILIDMLYPEKSTHQIWP
jgi:hypothetical protein